MLRMRGRCRRMGKWLRQMMMSHRRLCMLNAWIVVVLTLLLVVEHSNVVKYRIWSDLKPSLKERKQFNVPRRQVEIGIRQEHPQPQSLNGANLPTEIHERRFRESKGRENSESEDALPKLRADSQQVRDIYVTSHAPGQMNQSRQFRKTGRYLSKYRHLDIKWKDESVPRPTEEKPPPGRKVQALEEIVLEKSVRNEKNSDSLDFKKTLGNKNVAKAFAKLEIWRPQTRSSQKTGTHLSVSGVQKQKDNAGYSQRSFNRSRSGAGEVGWRSSNTGLRSPSGAKGVVSSITGAKGVHSHTGATGVHSHTGATGVHPKSGATGVHSHTGATGVHSHTGATGVHSHTGGSGAGPSVYRQSYQSTYLLGKAQVNPLNLFDDEIKRTPRASEGKPWPDVTQVVHNGLIMYTVDPDKLNFLMDSNRNCDIAVNAMKRYKSELVAFGVYAKNLSQNRAENQNSSAPKQHYIYKELKTVFITLHQNCSGAYPSLDMDESYTLNMVLDNVLLRANAVWGILRGLETLYQMMYVPAAYEGKLHIRSVDIRDKPAYAYRGILLDTARHYLSLSTIYTTLDAMTQNKYNALHWHMVDDQSFPFQSRRFPLLWKKGAYAYDKVYSFEDIAAVIEYARQRGIRVIPEFDTPGHTRAWLGQPNLLARCGNHRQKYTGVFDVTQVATYVFLRDFFAEVRSVFKDSAVHLGGDEVSVACWYNNHTILQVLKNFTHYELLNSYFEKFHDILDKIDSSWETIVWEEVYKNYRVNLQPNKTVIEVWSDMNVLSQALMAGFHVIFAQCWYLDHVRSERPDWGQYYDCDPNRYTYYSKSAYKGKLIGGEACMWSEWVDDASIVQRLWPRAVAPAERLWSNPKRSSYDLDVQQRFQEQLCRMKRRGIPVAPATGPGDCDGHMAFDHVT